MAGISSVLFDWSQTTRSLPCPFFVFNYPGTRLPEDPNKLGEKGDHKFFETDMQNVVPFFAVGSTTPAPHVVELSLLLWPGPGRRLRPPGCLMALKKSENLFSIHPF